MRATGSLNENENACNQTTHTLLLPSFLPNLCRCGANCFAFFSAYLTTLLKKIIMIIIIIIIITTTPNTYLDRQRPSTREKEPFDPIVD